MPYFGYWPPAGDLCLTVMGGTFAALLLLFCRQVKKGEIRHIKIKVLIRYIFRLLLGHCLTGGEHNRLRGIAMHHIYWLEAVEEEAFKKGEEEEEAPEECRPITSTCLK